MKTLIFIATICLVFFIVGASPVQSQTQVLEGYTFVRGGTGTSVCLGKWVPSRDIALPGVCQGQMVDVNYLAAISAKQSSDKLDQLLYALNSIDQKLAINNDQFQQLITATINTQNSIDQQNRQLNELLSEAIIQRFELVFDTLPEEILSNEVFTEALTKLKNDVLKEVEKHYLKRPETKKK